MKAKTGFTLRHIVGEYMLVPTGESTVTNQGYILLNGVSAFIWEQLQAPVTQEELLAAMLKKYAIDEATASADLEKLLSHFQEAGLLEDC